jgi:hypothetical protein
VLALDPPEMRRARELMRKYRDLPMDLDRRHFEVYRPHRMGRFQITP